MITINGVRFDRKPEYSCYECASFSSGRNDKWGWCYLFEFTKARYSHVPKRCRTLFEKGFRIGGELVIVLNEKNKSY